MSATSVLRQLIQASLAGYLYENAKFYAERLFAEYPIAEHLHLLAEIYFKQGKTKQTYLILQSSTYQPSRYLFAVACIALGKFSEAERALLPVSYMQPQSMTTEIVDQIPGGAAGLYLLGVICRKEHRFPAAIDYFHKSLQKDPSMWCAITELSEMGVNIDTSKLYGVNLESALKILHSTAPPVDLVSAGENKVFGNNPDYITKLEDKRIVESVYENNVESPRVSVSLGLSSLQLHVPFASPGMLPSVPGSVISAADSGINLRYGGGSSTASKSVNPRATLFEISTPGLTPIDQEKMASIYFNRNESETSVSTDDQRTVTKGKELFPSDSAVQTGGEYSHLATTKFVNSSVMKSDSNRRVSFGPTARLSFSSLGDMDCDMDTLEGNDEHPMKFQRMGNRNSPINPTGNPPVDIVSPIGHGTPSVVNYDTKLHANPSDDATRDQENSVKNTIRASATPNPEAGLSSGVTGDAYVVSLLVTLASAYQLLSSYQCRKCVNLLHKLPKKHFSTGWTQQILGKAYCEMNEYKNALLSLREMLRIEPFRVKGTETLSTALWHLKKDKELCALAQQIVEVDKYAPETWCVVGNCFSLQREPDAAIRFFQRALQIDPTNFPYAHTLCGHEYVNNEDLEKAINSFRNALLLDDRHYNAWYGLGSIYYRQEKYELAEYHFRRALSINSSSSVLQCYLAMVLHAQGSTVKSQCALEILTKATEHDRNNPQLRFQKAYIYMALEQLDDALVELEIVREQAPREAPVYAMLGQLYQQLGRKEDALRAINSAIDLDPKESMSLKSLLERMANDI